jgi:hypothetical protein
MVELETVFGVANLTRQKSRLLIDLRRIENGSQNVAQVNAKLLDGRVALIEFS